MLTLTMLHEKCHESRIPLRVAAIHFKKVFDTVEHPPLWYALKGQGVPLHYVTILRKLYDGQSERVPSKEIRSASLYLTQWWKR